MNEGSTGPGCAPRRRRRRGLLGLLLLATLVTCTTDRPTGPGGGAGRGYLAIRPVLATPVNLAAFGLTIDSLRVAAIRPVTDTVVDTTVFFDPNAASLSLSLSVPLLSTTETFFVLLELRAGSRVLFAGLDTVAVSAGAPDTSSTANVTLRYTGPGAGLTRLRIAPVDSVVTEGQTQQFSATADSNGTPVDSFYVNWSTSNAATVPINSLGLLQAPLARAVVFVRAVAPNGVRDSTRVTIVPLPSGVSVAGGDAQTAVVGTRLPLPLRVKVTATDQLGVKGVAVRFQAGTAGASVRDSVVVTDSLGIAEDSATLGTLAGNQAFQATVAGLPAVQFTVNATAGAVSAAQSVVTVSAPTLASGAGVTLTLRAKDAFGNNLTTGGAIVAFSAAGGTSTGSIGSTTDHGDGTYTATFTGILAGTPTTIGATINGTAVTTTLPTLAVTAGAISATGSVVSVSSPTVASGGSVTLTLQAKDAAGNPITTGGATVVFTSAGGTSTGTIGATTDHGNGTYTAPFTGAVAGTPTTVGATVNGAAVTTTLPTVTVTAGAVSAATSVLTATSGTVAAGASATLTLQAKDAAGNTLTTGGATVTFTASGGTSVGTIGATADHGDGTYSAAFTGVTAGTATTVAAVVNGAPTTSTVSLTVVPGNAVTAQSVITVSNDTVVSGGTITLTLQAKDSLGNNLTTGGLVVVFTSSGGTSAGTIGPTTDHANGTYTASFTGSAAGTPTTIGATIGGQPVTSTLPTVTVIAGGISTATSRVTVSSASIASGTAATLTLQAKDAAGNNLTTGGAVVVFTASGGVGVSTGTIAPSPATDNGNGTYTATFTGVLAGTATTIGATIGGAPVTSTLPAITVTPGGISVATSVVTVSDTAVLVGGSDTLFLRARDAAGNLLTTGGALVVFTQSAGAGVSAGTISATTDLNNGLYRAIFTGTVPGTPTTIGATIGGVPVTSTPLPAIRVGVTTHVSDITADSVWTAAASPHVVGGYLRILNNATLTIEPGAVVKFNAGTGLQVGDTATNQAGGLVMDGTAASILLTANSTAPVSGFWRGIEVQRSLPQGPWRRVTIEYAGGSRGAFGGVAAEACVLFVNRSGAAVDLDSVRIRQCTHAGIHHFGGASHVHRSEIDTVSGSGVHADFDARLELDSTVLRGAANSGLEILSPNVRLLPSSGNAILGSAGTAVAIQAAQLPGMLRQDTIGGNAANIIDVNAGTAVDTAFTLFRQPRGLVFGNDFDYRVTGLLTVRGPLGPVVTLDSNLVVRFFGQSGLVIGDSAGTAAGGIRSLGTGPANEPRLTSIDVPGAPGEWLGVEIGRVAAADTLQHVHIEFAGDSLPGRTAHRAGLWIRNASAFPVVIDSVTLVANGATTAPGNSAGLAVTGAAGGVEIRHSLADNNPGYGFAFGVAAKFVGNTATTNLVGLLASDGRLRLTATDSIAGNTLTSNGTYPAVLKAGALPGWYANNVTGNGRDTLLLDGGVLTADATLPYQPASIWRVLSTITVDSGATLTIAPSDTVAFDSTAGLVVGGLAPAALAADGSNGPILFTASGPLPLGWAGIDFHLMSGSGTTTNNVFRHVDVDRAGFTRPCFGDCLPFIYAALRFTDSLAPTNVNLAITNLIVRRSNTIALDFRRGGTGTVDIQSSQFYQNLGSPMIRARPGSGSLLTIGTSDLYHYRGQAIEGIYRSADPADSITATGNWWGDVAGIDSGFNFQDSLGRASTVFGAVRTVPFATAPFFPVGPAVGVVTTRDSLLSPVSLGASVGIHARVVDAGGRGVSGQTVSWTPLPAGASTITPSSASGAIGGRVDAAWSFTNVAGRLTAHATGGGGFTDYFIDVQPGLTTAVNWSLDAARSQGVVTGPKAITFTSTNRTGVVVTHSHDSFNNATQPFNLCFTDVNVPGCTNPFPAYGVVDSTHSDGVDGDTIFFHAAVTQPTTFVLRATYSLATGGQQDDSVVVTMASIPFGVRIDRDQFTAGVQPTPDTAVFIALCPGGQPNSYCQAQYAVFVVDSGLAPVANQDAAYQWTLTPATGTPVTVTTSGLATDSALVTAVANGFATLVVKDTTTNNFGSDTLSILVQQTLSQVVVSPDTVSVPVGGTATFTATTVDVSGSTIPDAQIHWRPYNDVNPHITITDTATANQATVRLDSTPLGQEYLVAYAVRGPGDTIFGYGQLINPVLKQLPVGLEPWAIAANTQTHAVYVGHQFGQLHRIDGNTDAVVDTSTPALTIAALAVNSVTNRVYAATSQGVVVLDGTSLSTVTTVATGSNSPGVTNLQGLTVDSVGNRIFVTVAPPGAAAPQHLLRQIDGATNTFNSANDVSLPDTGAGAAFNPADGRVYVAIPDSDLVVVVDPATHAVVNRIPVGTFPTFVAVNPVTNRVYALNQSTNDLSVIDAASGKVQSTVPLYYNVGSLGVDVVHNRVYVGVINVPYLLVVNGADDVFENILIAGDPAFSEAIRGVVVDGAIGNGKIFTANYSTGTVVRLAF